MTAPDADRHSNVGRPADTESSGGRDLSLTKGFSPELSAPPSEVKNMRNEG